MRHRCPPGPFARCRSSGGRRKGWCWSCPRLAPATAGAEAAWTNDHIVSSLSSPPSDRRFECLPAGTRRKVLDCAKACRPMPTFTRSPCGPASTALPSTPGVGAGTGRRCTARLFSTWPSRSRPSAARRCQRAPSEHSSVLWRGVGSDAKELLGVRTPEPGNHGADRPRGGVTGHRDVVRLLRLGEELKLAARVVSIRNMERGTDLLLLLDPADRDDLVAFLGNLDAS